MEIKTFACTVLTILCAGSAIAQQRAQPAPTGQVPKSYSGQASGAYSGYQPKPTGQVPTATAQPAVVPAQTNTSGQIPAAAAPTQSNGNVAPATVTQSWQVPKVTTSQDQRTMPERYAPIQPAQATQQTIVIQSEDATPQTAPQQTVPGQVPAQTNPTTVPQTTTPATARQQPTQQSGQQQATPATTNARPAQPAPSTTPKTSQP